MTSWIQLEEREATVRGKGHKTRSVPLGGKAIDVIQRWLERRHELLPASAPPEVRAALFLGVRGQRISPHSPADEDARERIRHRHQLVQSLKERFPGLPL